MKRLIILLAFFAIGFGAVAQSVSESTIVKRENRKGMVLKEWNTAAGDKRAFLDRVTTYDEMGRKIEEIEYNDRDKVSRIKKYEYNEDGSKKCQKNYYPNGKLESVKTFEYVPK